MSLWITRYYVNEYQLDLTTAALLASIFVLPSGLVRALGGWLSDRYGAYVVTWGVMWVSWACLFLLSYPQTLMTIKVISGEDWNFGIGLNIWAFTTLLFILGIAWGLGKASVFKGLADEYPDNLGVASGIVGLAGGMGGFCLPILFGLLNDMTRINSSVFMLLFGATCVSLLLVYFTFGREHQADVIQHAKDEAEGDAFLHSMSDVVAGQRKALNETIGFALRTFSQQLSPMIKDKSALEEKLESLTPTLEHFRNVFILDAKGIQLTANLSKDGRDEDQLGRNRSRRPYMKGMFDGKDFKLSESYISRNKRRPSLTAIHVIRGNIDELLGFVGVDYDLSSLPSKGALFKGSREWKRIKSNSTIDMGFFQLQRKQSCIDDNIDDVLLLMERLMLEHGVFHGKLHFSSSGITLWHFDTPFNYHILNIDEIISPDICLAYPQQAYGSRATVAPQHIKKIFENFRQLRLSNESIYLRAGSLNICNGMVGLNFSCDGSHYMHYDEFLEKDHEFWFGI